MKTKSERGIINWQIQTFVQDSSSKKEEGEGESIVQISPLWVLFPLTTRELRVPPPAGLTTVTSTCMYNV